MKTLLKSLAITGVTLIGLNTLTSHAATKDGYQSHIQQYKSISTFYFAPEIVSEGSQHSVSTLASANNQTIKAPLHKGCKATPKKNELYELGAIFNDKLQMLLSYLDTNDSNKDFKMVEKKTDPRVVSFKKNKHS